MPDERTYYVLCADNCKFEGMTKEQIYDAIAEATGSTPTPVDEAFITKIKETNANANLYYWVGTENQYNALESLDEDTVYIVRRGTYAKLIDENVIMEMIERTVLDVDSEIDSDSENPVQNKVIAEAISGINTELNGKASANHNHDELYAAKTHNHDGRYSLSAHNHDDRYYTETETDSLLNNLQKKITFGTSNPTGGSDGDIYIKY